MGEKNHMLFWEGSNTASDMQGLHPDRMPSANQFLDPQPAQVIFKWHVWCHLRNSSSGEIGSYMRSKSHKV